VSLDAFVWIFGGLVFLNYCTLPKLGFRYTAQQAARRGSFLFIPFAVAYLILTGWGLSAAQALVLAVTLVLMGVFASCIRGWINMHRWERVGIDPMFAQSLGLKREGRRVPPGPNRDRGRTVDKEQAERLHRSACRDCGAPSPCDRPDLYRAQSGDRSSQRYIISGRCDDCLGSYRYDQIMFGPDGGARIAYVAFGFLVGIARFVVTNAVVLAIVIVTLAVVRWLFG
jgi:hypothetical protein